MKWNSMTWQSLPMTPDCTYHYKKVRKFTLVKETPKAIKIRLEKRIMDKGLNGLAINNLQLGPKTVKVDTDLVDTRQVYRE